MAFFKFRWPGQKQQDNKSGKSVRPARTESIDAMRRRARHRLMGAAVLIVLGVVGFPMLFDTQPRPIPVDTPIEIPDRNKVAPLVVPAEAPLAGASPDGTANRGLDDGEEIVSSHPSLPKIPEPAFVPQVRPEPKPVAKAEPKPEPKLQTKSDPKPPSVEQIAKPDSAKPVKSAISNQEAARARALLEGRTAPQPALAFASTERTAVAQERRFTVQVGAFADANAAQEVRQKLERAGLKTYTQVVNTKDGKRTRVRVGPLEGRVEADKAAARVKALGLPASVQTL